MMLQHIRTAVVLSLLFFAAGCFSPSGEPLLIETVLFKSGLSWSAAVHDTALIEPVCQASFLRYSLEKKQGRNRILFSNPADTKRINMTVRVSYDESSTWPVGKQLWEGPSAYSCLTVLSDNTIGYLYERGVEHPYETITFSVFNLEWLTD